VFDNFWPAPLSFLQGGEFTSRREREGALIYEIRVYEAFEDRAGLLPG
jgi:hypothetical protein